LGPDVGVECRPNLKVGVCIGRIASTTRVMRLGLDDPTKANSQLRWIPKYNAQTLVENRMQSDIELMKRDKFLKDSGHAIMRYFK